MTLPGGGHASAASQTATRVNEPLLSLHDAANSLIETQRRLLMTPSVLTACANSPLIAWLSHRLNSASASFMSDIETVDKSISLVGVNVQTRSRSLRSWTDTLERALIDKSTPRHWA